MGNDGALHPLRVPAIAVQAASAGAVDVVAWLLAQPGVEVDTVDEVRCQQLLSTDGTTINTPLDLLCLCRARAARRHDDANEGTPVLCPCAHDRRACSQGVLARPA
jgi:hypothetical protein